MNEYEAPDTEEADQERPVAAASKPERPLIFRHYKKLIIAAVIVALLPVVAMAAAYAIIAPNQKFVLDASAARAKDISVGFVLGAGVMPDGKPYKELQGRLDVAAQALQDGVVDQLVLSGDNRFEHYDEPQAMINYLVDEKHLDKTKLHPDYAGRSTYESCERAAKIFQLKKVVLISAGSHLPRAIFLCRHFGIEAYGLASNVEANNSWRREQLARVKAIYNAYLIGEPTILGDPINL